MTEQQRQTAKRNALAFRIWQIGTAVDWDITASGIADKLGLSPSSVGRICAGRGWPVRHHSRDGFLSGRPDGRTTTLSSIAGFDFAPYRRMAAQAAD